MHTDFNSVEAELREIEADFSSGRMNAFGSAQAQDAFLRELKRIAEIETQVFYKTCSILKSGNNADHALLTNVFASAQPPSRVRGAGSTSRTTSPGRSRDGHPGSSGSMDGLSFVGSVGDSVGSRFGRSHAAASSTPGPGLHGTGNNGSTNHNEGGPGSGAAPHIKSTEWGNETGFPDKVFEDVAERFRSLETDFRVLGNQLREISKHVVQLNVMSEEVNRSNGYDLTSTGSNTGGGDVGQVGGDGMERESDGNPLDSLGYGGRRGGADGDRMDDTTSGVNETAYWR